MKNFAQSGIKWGILLWVISSIVTIVLFLPYSVIPSYLFAIVFSLNSLISALLLFFLGFLIGIQQKCFSNRSSKTKKGVVFGFIGLWLIVIFMFYVSYWNIYRSVESSLDSIWFNFIVNSGWVAMCVVLAIFTIAGLIGDLITKNGSHKTEILQSLMFALFIVLAIGSVGYVLSTSAPS